MQGKVRTFRKFHCSVTFLLFVEYIPSIGFVIPFSRRKSFQIFQRNAKSFFVEPPLPPCTNLQRLLLPVQQPSEVSTIKIKMTQTVTVPIALTFEQGSSTMRGWGAKPRQRQHKSTCSVNHWDSGGDHDNGDNDNENDDKNDCEL